MDKGFNKSGSQNADSPHKPDYEELLKVVEELAKLQPLQYEQVRESKAKELGIRVSSLDKEVEAKRKTQEASESPADDELLDGVEPWPYPVKGAEVADIIRQELNRYLVLPKGADTAIILWIMSSYAIDAFRIFPKLLLSSPEKRCGKTTTLEVVDSLANRSITAANASPAVLYRAIEAWKPTLLIDEADTFIHGKDELRGIINSGHTKSTAHVLRVEDNGGQLEPKKFSTWAPMVIAMIKKPPSTILDRSVVVELQRKPASQKTDRLPIELKAQNIQHRQKIKRWADDNFQKLKAIRPQVPALRNERAMDNWTPLLTVADLIGIGEIARSTMLHLSEIDDEEPAIEAQLLMDIQEAMEGRSKIFSDDLVRLLIEDEDKPWCEWRHGQPMSKNSLSKLLKPYKIKPKPIRIGEKNRRGYELTQFDDAFARYIPETNETTEQAPSHKAFSDSQNETPIQPVSFTNSPKPAPDKGCFDVSFQGRGFDKVVEL